MRDIDFHLKYCILEENLKLRSSEESAEEGFV
jgi:hypothetical protein